MALDHHRVRAVFPIPLTRLEGEGAILAASIRVSPASGCVMSVFQVQPGIVFFAGFLLSGCAESGFSPLSAPDEALRASYFVNVGDHAAAAKSLDRALTIAPNSALRLRLLKKIAAQTSDEGAAPDAAQSMALEQAALLGDKGSLERLARSQRASGIMPNTALMPLYTRLAETTSNDAALLLADLSLKASPPGEADAMRWWTLAGQRGSKPAARKLAMSHALSGNDAAALDWASKAYETDKPDAAFRLARGFMDGTAESPKSSVKNSSLGLHWLGRAVALGQPRAARYAAATARQFYVSGAIRTADQLVDLLARHSPTLADDTSNAAALALLRGRGVRQNVPAGLALLERGLSRGSEQSKRILLASNRLDLDRASQKRVDGHLQRLAAAGDNRARQALEGPGDREAARARALSPVASLREKLTATIAEGGDTAPIESSLESLANRGDHEAMMALADTYAARAMTSPTDSDKAIRWLTRAADAKMPEALYRLGVTYADGLGVTPDLAKGRSYLEQAKAAGNPLAEDALRRYPLP
jgi:TPR repeat protein